MTKEGSLQPPIRHPISWEDPAFYDEAAIEAELTRVFDICHGCRRCFNLCESFPKLFDLIDGSETGELASVSPEEYKPVVEACTLCDMCFMTKCPYVPPHPFQLDFPHLMLRARAADRKKGEVSWVRDQVNQTDRNGTIASHVAPLANWSTKTGNKLTRPLLEKVAGIDRRADLPRFHRKTFVQQAAHKPPLLDETAPGFGERVVLYATCFVNYNNPRIGEAALFVLARNGVEVEVAYPECCGMPQWEQGNLEAVAQKALRIADSLLPWVEKGYQVVSTVPSCSLMLKTEWPLLWPENEDIRRLASATCDLSEYLVKLANAKGLAPGLRGLPEGVTLHIPCHARAQNQGRKAQELLKLIPDTPLHILERCSGHGGSWGFFKENFSTAMKVGRPVAREALKSPHLHCVSECPLAAAHIHQGMERLKGEGATPSVRSFSHPIEVLAHAYGAF